MSKRKTHDLETPALLLDLPTMERNLLKMARFISQGSAALQLAVDTRNLIERHGIPCQIVSAGSTATYSIAGRYPGVTEIQAGSYLTMDTSYRGFAPDFEPALSVLATIISKTAGQRVVVDAGRKALSGEKGLPEIKGLEGVRLKALHSEHATIEILDPAVPVEVGDKIEILVHYSDATVQLHRRMYGVREGEVEVDSV